MLTVTKRTLAVLPCLAPEDRGQRNKKTVAPLSKAVPSRGVESRSLLERMFTRRVVKHASVTHDVGFSGMEVSARWVHAQCPSRLSILLPRGEPHRTAQEIRNRSIVDGLCGIRAATIE